MAYTRGKSPVTVRAQAETRAHLAHAVDELRRTHDALNARKAELEREVAMLQARRRRERAKKPAPTRYKPLPAPKHGGPEGLAQAAAESISLDRRTEAMIAAGKDSLWIREYKRVRNIK